MAVRRVPAFIPHEGRHLYGVTYLPTEVSRAPLGLVVCPPFADEAVHAHRVLVDWAVHLAGGGIPALLFDYAGTGDSEGEFEDGSVERYVRDIHGAAAYFQASAGVARCGLVGLRLGANLAARAAAENPGLSPLVLWAPIPRLREYFRSFLRLRRLTELTTLYRSTTTGPMLEARLRSGEGVDVLGYGISPAMAHGFLDGGGTGPPVSAPTLRVEVAPPSATRGRALPEDGGLAVDGARVTVERVVDDAFWDRAQVGDHPALFQVTRDWLRRTVAS